MNMSEQKQLAVQSDDPAVRLENWEVCECWQHDFTHLAGDVYNHPDFNDGEPVHTSKLISVTGNIGVCKSRTYHLGKKKGA